MKKSKGNLGSDFSHPGAPKVSSAPFATSWTNNLPTATTKTMTGAPGGVLSPKELNGTGLKKKGK